MIYTTLKDFELFKKEAKKWIDRLGLLEWEFTFFHENIDPDATCTSYFMDKKMVLVFAKEIEKEDQTKREYIKTLAQHEVLHALFENLYHQARDRSFSAKNYFAEEHAIIHRLQKAFKE